MVFLIKFMTLSDILYIFRQFIIQLYRTISYAFLLSIHAIARFFVSSCSHWECVDQCTVALLCFWSTCGILSLPHGSVCGLLTSSESPPLFVPFVFPHHWQACLGSLVVLGGSFEVGVFPDQYGLSFGHPFGNVCFL